MTSGGGRRTGGSQAAGRRLWMVLGLVLLSALAIVALVHVLVPERSNDIWVESAKSALQLAVLATTTGVVAAVLRDREAAREADGRRRASLLAFLDQVQTTYVQVKAARRILRSLGFDVTTGPPLSAEQATGFRAQMAGLNEAELTFEADVRRAARLGRELGPGAAAIGAELDGVTTYLRRVLFEWEADPTVIATGGDRSALERWPSYRRFVAYDDDAVAEFTASLTEPMGHIEAIILDALDIETG